MATWDFLAKVADVWTVCWALFSGPISYLFRRAWHRARGTPWWGPPERQFFVDTFDTQNWKIDREVQLLSRRAIDVVDDQAQQAIVAAAKADANERVATAEERARKEIAAAKARAKEDVAAARWWADAQIKKTEDKIDKSVARALEATRPCCR